MPEPFFLRKMQHSREAVADSRKLSYRLGQIELNDLIGSAVRVSFSGLIECVACASRIKKTFGDGYCFRCCQTLAACDLCILKPELCHIKQGTCREPEWAKDHCLIPHVVYLANTTGLKVGITREHKKFERWGDQGAVAAIVLARVPERHVAGLVEVALKGQVGDKADWRALIRGERHDVNLHAERERIRGLLPAEFQQYIVRSPEFDAVHQFEYPVLQYPQKAITHSAEKTPVIEGVLEGIRGQYLFIAGKALNIRKYSGYQIAFEPL